MENFYPAITGYAVIDVLRNHMLIHKVVHTSIPAHFFISCKGRNNRPRELCTSLHQRFQRENRTRARPSHVRRSPPIDLVIPDCRLERVVGPSRRVRWDNIHMPVEKYLRPFALAPEVGLKGPRPNTTATPKGEGEGPSIRLNTRVDVVPADAS